MHFSLFLHTTPGETHILGLAHTLMKHFGFRDFERMFKISQNNPLFINCTWLAWIVDRTS